MEAFHSRVSISMLCIHTSAHHFTYLVYDLTTKFKIFNQKMYANYHSKYQPKPGHIRRTKRENTKIHNVNSVLPASDRMVGSILHVYPYAPL